MNIVQYIKARVLSVGPISQGRLAEWKQLMDACFPKEFINKNPVVNDELIYNGTRALSIAKEIDGGLGKYTERSLWRLVYLFRHANDNPTAINHLLALESLYKQMPTAVASFETKASALKVDVSLAEIAGNYSAEIKARSAMLKHYASIYTTKRESQGPQDACDLIMCFYNYINTNFESHPPRQVGVARRLQGCLSESISSFEAKKINDQWVGMSAEKLASVCSSIAESLWFYLGLWKECAREDLSDKFFATPKEDDFRQAANALATFADSVAKSVQVAREESFRRAMNNR